MRPRRLVMVSWLLATSILPLMAPNASAHAQLKRDYNDTRGPLDMQAVVINHDERHLWGRIYTFERWRAGTVRGGDKWLAVDFDTSGGGDADYFVIVLWKNGSLQAIVRKWVGNNYVRVGSGFAKKEDDRTVYWQFRLDLIRPRGGFFRWAPITSWDGYPCGSQPCYDDAPNRGMYGHDL